MNSIINSKMDNIPKPISVSDFNQWLKSKSDKPVVIDVRESSEIEIASFPYVDLNIPISKVSLDDVTLQISNYPRQNFVILCHKGIRSYHFAQWMLDNSLAQEVWNLEGGIDEWSIYIDSTIPRY
tara:strand:- start:1159 stop:1533 length:375 start_codon:yes stop_codon:yes gene_type:complete